MISLKKVLFINGASSGMTAIGLMIVPRIIAELFQVRQPAIFIGVGVFLLAFSTLVLVEASSAQTRPRRVQFIIALDVLWVVASGILVLATLSTISFIGHFLIAGVALWVGLMAYLQGRGMKEIPG